MSIVNVLNKTLTIDGKAYTQNITVNADQAIRREVTLPAAKVGSLTVRTDSDTGTLTMDAGHSITTGAKIDIYWVESGLHKSRRGVTVGTVATNSVPIDLGSGDNLPPVSTPVTVMVQQTLELRFDGDDMKVLVVTANAVATVVFAGADNAEDHHVTIQQSGQVKDWYSDNGDTNPLAGQTETQVFVTHGDSSGSKTVKIAVGTV